MFPEPSSDRNNSWTGNQVSGRVDGPVVQAHSIHGDVSIRTCQRRQPEVPLLVTARSCNPRRLGEIVIPGTGDGDSDELVVPASGARVLVEAFTSQAVVLQRMRPIVLSRKPPRPCHVLITYCPVLEKRYFATDLNIETPVLTPQPALDERSSAPDFPFTVTSSEPELFIISPHATSEVEWQLELDWTSMDRSGTVTVSNEGGPFQFHPGHPHYEASPEEIKRWSKRYF